MSKSIGVACVIVVGLGWAAMSLPVHRLRAADAGARVAVVAELFTSEGCSSCPPADEVLTRLMASQPVAGVEIIALGEHVDYWDRLGWRDPFSSPTFTSRQSQYDDRVFRSHRIYTPQIVVDGQSEEVGSDLDAVRRAIERAAKQPKAAVTVGARADGDRLSVDVRVDAAADVPLRDTADIMVAITEDRLETHVRRGENSGRVLEHTAVVRSLSTVGALSLGRRTLSITAPLTLSRDWKPERLRVVAFVQETKSRRMVGAGSITLASSGLHDAR